MQKQKQVKHTLQSEGDISKYDNILAYRIFFRFYAFERNYVKIKNINKQLWCYCYLLLSWFGLRLKFDLNDANKIFKETLVVEYLICLYLCAFRMVINNYYLMIFLFICSLFIIKLFFKRMHNLFHCKNIIMIDGCSIKNQAKDVIVYDS